MNDSTIRGTRARARQPEDHLEPSHAWILGIALEDDGSVAAAPADIAAGLGAAGQRRERPDRQAAGRGRRSPR
ncbi:MAG TPA: hypothetical protein VFW86_06475 [Candidatus Limnocylindrales bacterium]|jgi:hypothetical protein|nr:hypothetical protein [Candidatus Limnocylindrales bacterium]